MCSRSCAEARGTTQPATSSKNAQRFVIRGLLEIKSFCENVHRAESGRSVEDFTYRRLDATLQIAVGEAGIAMGRCTIPESKLHLLSTRPYGVSCRRRIAIQRQLKVSWRARGVARKRTVDNHCFVYPEPQAFHAKTRLRF